MRESLLVRRLRILTWATRPRYLAALAHAPHDFHVLCTAARGRGELPRASNLHPLPPAEARRARFDLVVFQDDAQYLDEQYEILTPAQRRLPRIYLEHEAPREHPVESRHVAAAPDALVVHVTAFNRLMWDNGAAPTRVIEHGVVDPGCRYSGELARGLVLIDDAAGKGRRRGLDLYEQARRRVPLELHRELPDGAGRYRFIFSPARYASPGFALIEAMMAGLPVLALATGEMATVIRDGDNGFVDTDPEALLSKIELLLEQPEEARRLGRRARAMALARFGIERFVAGWNEAFAAALGEGRERTAA